MGKIVKSELSDMLDIYHDLKESVDSGGLLSHNEFLLTRRDSGANHPSVAAFFYDIEGTKSDSIWVYFKFCGAIQKISEKRDE